MAALRYTKVLAFDVGEKNLAFCFRHIHESPRVWDVRDCVRKAKPTITEARIGFLQVLDETVKPLIQTETPDVIVIEQQVNHNNRMRMLEQVLHTWLHCFFPGIESSAMSSKLKLKDYSTHENKQIKARAIAVTKDILRERKWSMEVLDAHAEKQDDLSDTFLMTEYVFSNQSFRAIKQRKKQKVSTRESASST